MKITGHSNNIPLEVTKDHRAKVLSASESFMHAMAEVGRAWSIPFTQTGAANTTDNTVFHFTNDSDEAFDIHKVMVSSAEPGLWTLGTGRTTATGGAAITLRQLNTLSGQTLSNTAVFGTALGATGTASDLTYMRVAADTPTDLIAELESLQVEPSGTIEVRFQADTGSNVMAVNIFTHGLEPWEDS